MAVSPWRLRLLGDFELSDGERSLPRLPSRAATLLLARLAMAPERAQPRESLADWLWPDAVGERSRARLRTTLSTLKALLEPPGRVGGPVVVADRISVRLAPGAIACDALDFERCARAGDSATAAALYRGDLLPGHYDDWVLEQRTRLQELAERLGIAAEGAPPPPVAALDAARIAPQPVVAPPTLASAAIPRYLTRLLGAEPVLARLLAQVRTSRLVCVLGPGGSGKTRLAAEAALRLLDAGTSPFELIVFVSWVGCETRASCLDRMLAGLRLPGGNDPAERLRTALLGRSVLLVLDNCEQIDSTARSMIAAWVEESPTLHVLATSRRPLGLGGEHQFWHEALPVPEDDAPLHEAAASPAVALFVERARDSRPDVTLHEGNRRAVIRLVRQLEGLPLAIELAGARVRTLPPAVLSDRLWAARTLTPGVQPEASALKLLSRAGPRAGSDPRHASMEAVIDWSCSLLDNEQRRLLDHVCCAGAPLALSIIETAMGKDATVQLDSLVTDSLLVAHEGRDSTLRFAPREPVREYVRSRLPARARREHGNALRRALVNWAKAQPGTPNLAEVREEQALAAWALQDGAEQGDAAGVVDLVLALLPLARGMNLPTGAVEALARALAELADADPELAARGCAQAVYLSYEAGDRAGADAWATKAIARWPTDPTDRARALHAVARWHLRARRDGEAARRLAQEGYEIAHAAGAEGARGSHLALLATIAHQIDGDTTAARNLYAQALRAYERAGLRHAVAGVRYNLAVTDIEAGRLREALHRLDRLVPGAQAAGDQQVLAAAHNARGRALLELGDVAAALAATRESLAVAWAAMETETVVHALWSLPALRLRLDQTESAVQAAAAAEQAWTSLFGEIAADEATELESIRREAAARMGPPEAEAHWHAARALTLAQVVQAQLRT